MAWQQRGCTVVAAEVALAGCWATKVHGHDAVHSRCAVSGDTVLREVQHDAALYGMAYQPMLQVVQIFKIHA
jgi:hypothetical protein